MTHGEAWYEEKQNIGLNDFDETRGVKKTLPPRMNPEDAVKYYNTKLFAYWMDRLDDQISIERKAKMIGYLMFGDHTRETIFKEMENDS